jgi:hypothetical protein
VIPKLNLGTRKRTCPLYLLSATPFRLPHTRGPFAVERSIVGREPAEREPVQLEEEQEEQREAANGDGGRRVRREPAPVADPVPDRRGARPPAARGGARPRRPLQRFLHRRRREPRELFSSLLFPTAVARFSRARPFLSAFPFFFLPSFIYRLSFREFCAVPASIVTLESFRFIGTECER